MPEYIERETALKYQVPLAFQGPGGKHTVRVVSVSAIKAIPAADVVEVVRCKDCCYQATDKIFGFCWCNLDLSAKKVKPDDFCSYGKRRTNHE